MRKLLWAWHRLDQRVLLVWVGVIILGPIVVGAIFDRRKVVAVYQRLRGRCTVEERLDQYGPQAKARLMPLFNEAGVAYPPDRLVLIGLKTERRLEVWAAGEDGLLKHMRTYPIVEASGTIGPKLREGDRQVPEGLYEIESLNPNSMFHLSLRISCDGALRRPRGTDAGAHGGPASQ